MDFKEKLISSFMVFEQDIDLSNPVHEIRSKSKKSFEEKGFQTKNKKLEIHFFGKNFKK